MKDKKDKMPSWAVAGHSKPVTRRELLASGSMAFAASFLVPNWISLLTSSVASADDTNCGQGGTMPAFITLNLFGGMAMSANYLPMGKDKNSLKSYSKLGLGSQVSIEREFANNVPFAGNNGSGSLHGKFLVGIRNRASKTVLSKASFIAIPCASADDSNTNKFDMSGLVMRAGSSGKFIQNASGGGLFRHQPAISAAPAPLQVTQYDDIVNSIGYTAALKTKLNTNQKTALARLANKLSTSQARRLASVTSSKGVDTILDCAGITNVNLMGEGAGNSLNPLNNSDVASIWNVNASTAKNSQDLIFGSLSYNTLSGNSGPSLLQIGGYDYHGQTRAATDMKDQQAGETVGMILSTAERLQKPVCIWIVSDGSVTSADSTQAGGGWTGDSGGHGVAYMIMYSPTAAPVTNGFQIGYFNDNQSADPGFVTGDNPELATAAAFANYLKFAGKFSLFDSIVGRSFNSLQLDEILKVG